MKTRSEIIRALLEPIREAKDDGTLDGDVAESFYEIWNAAGQTDCIESMSTLIFHAKFLAVVYPDHLTLFETMISVAQDELMTSHRAVLKDAYRHQIDTARAFLVDKLGSAQLADILIREIKRETSDD